MKNNFLKIPVTICAFFLFLTGCGKNETADTIEPIGFTAENVLTCVNENDQTVLRIYSAPVEDAKHIITKQNDGSYTGNGKYMIKTLPETWSSDNPIIVTQFTNFVEITPVGQGSYESELTQVTNMFGQSHDTVVYKDVFGEGIDLNCTVTTFGVNFGIVFTKPPEQNTYEVNVRLQDLAPETGSPDYILFKARWNGEVKAIIETPLAADKSGQWRFANAVRLAAEDSDKGEYTVEYTIDEDFLADDATTYPVSVTHSINLYKPKQPDSTAYENTGETAGHYLSPYFLTGDTTTKGEGWTYVRYETLNSLPIAADKIISARYIFYNLFDAPKEVLIGAYAVTGEWGSLSIRWSNRPSNDKTPVSQTPVQKAGEYSLDITTLFQEMLKNKNNKNTKYSVSKSFMFKSDTAGSGLIFPSGDGGLYSPYLEIVLSE